MPWMGVPGGMGKVVGAAAGAALVVVVMGVVVSAEGARVVDEGVGAAMGAAGMEASVGLMRQEGGAGAAGQGAAATGAAGRAAGVVAVVAVESTVVPLTMPAPQPQGMHFAVHLQEVPAACRGSTPAWRLRPRVVGPGRPTPRPVRPQAWLT